MTMGYEQYSKAQDNFRAMMETLPPATQGAISWRMEDPLTDGEHKLFSVVFLAAGVEGDALEAAVEGANRIYQAVRAAGVKGDPATLCPLLEGICQGVLAARGVPRALRGPVSLGAPRPTPARVAFDAMAATLALGE